MLSFLLHPPLSPVDTHSPSMQAAELRYSATRPLHSTHSGAVLEEERRVGGARSAGRRVEICGDRASLKADPARPVFVPALTFPSNINQDSGDEDEGLGTAVMVPQGGHSSLNAPIQKHQQHPHAHHHPNQMPQQKHVPQNSNTVNFVNGSTAHSQTLHASMPARPRGGGGALADAPTSPAIDIHRSHQLGPSGIVRAGARSLPVVLSQCFSCLPQHARALFPSLSVSLALSRACDPPLWFCLTQSVFTEQLQAPPVRSLDPSSCVSGMI